MIVIMNLLSDPQLVNRHPKDRVPRLVNHPKDRVLHSTVRSNEKFHLQIHVCQKYDVLKRRELQKFGNNVYIHKTFYLISNVSEKLFNDIYFLSMCLTIFIFFRWRIDQFPKIIKEQSKIELLLFNR
jgi:hypothetical protein